MFAAKGLARGVVAVSVGTALGAVSVVASSPASASRSAPTEGAPAVTGITPPAGHPSGGDIVTIAGRGLSTASAVHFGAAVSTQLHVISSTRIKVVTPKHPFGTVTVRVQTSSGRQSPRNDAARFTFTDAPKPLNWSMPVDPDPRSLYLGYVDISCASRHVCIAEPAPQNDADAVTPVMLQDGAWQRVQLPPSPTGSFTSADSSTCPLPTACLVVGLSGTQKSPHPTAWTWDGSVWSQAPEPQVGTAWGRPACAHGYAYCLVQGPDGVVLIYANGQWTATAQQFEPLACASPTFCMVRTATGDYAVWNGSAVGPGNQPFGSTAPTISCASPEFCLAVGDRGSDIPFWTFDGVAWSTAKSTGMSGYQTGPSCTTATSCWATIWAYGDVSRAVHFDGTTWTAHGRAAYRQLTALSCWSAHGCRAVDRAAFIHTFSGGTWSQHQPVPRVGHPTNVSCATDAMCVVVDLTGHAVRFDGTHWSAPEAVDVHREIRSVSCPTVHFCMTVDNLGYAARYAHGRWHPPTRVFAVTDPNSAAEVSCSSPDFCGAVVEGGRAAVYSDGRWRAPQQIDAVAISCTPPKQCVATGRGISVYTGRWSRPQARAHNFWNVGCAGSFCAFDSDQVWMRNDGVQAVGVRKRGPYGAIACATRHYCLFAESTQTGSGLAVDGASWAEAQIPEHNPKVDPPVASFVAGDCSTHFCMVLVGDRYGADLQETHASL
jgi:hypothetical protein